MINPYQPTTYNPYLFGSIRNFLGGDIINKGYKLVRAVFLSEITFYLRTVSKSPFHRFDILPILTYFPSPPKKSAKKIAIQAREGVRFRKFSKNKPIVRVYPNRYNDTPTLDTCKKYTLASIGYSHHA